MEKRVLVAMSGGVDSSVAAALLKEQGFFVIGVFMHFWLDPSGAEGLDPSGAEGSRANNPLTSSGQNKCCSIEAQEQARRVAQKIGIPLYTINYKKPFKDIVVDYYIAEYQAGRTPNPCVVCNQFIKFDLLLREAEKQGCDYLATGHYARIARDLKSLPRRQAGQISNLKTAVDKNKDQTYFLYRLTQEKLKKILFPVGGYKKSKVRKIAEKFGLPTATRKDSRGICFVSATNEDFLRKYLRVEPGDIVDRDGVKVGEHQGLLYYTVGQRHLKTANFKLQRSKLGKEKDVPPLYIVSIDIKKNQLVIGREEDLYKKSLVAEEVSWISGKEPKTTKIGARIRYRHPINDCVIKKIAKGKYQAEFKKAQRAITPGQSVVFYKNDQVLGGGIILR